MDYLINNKKGSSSTTVLGAYHAMFAAYGIAAVVMASLEPLRVAGTVVQVPNTVIELAGRELESPCPPAPVALFNPRSIAWSAWLCRGTKGPRSRSIVPFRHWA